MATVIVIFFINRWNDQHQCLSATSKQDTTQPPTQNTIQPPSIIQPLEPTPPPEATSPPDIQPKPKKEPKIKPPNLQPPPNILPEPEPEPEQKSTPTLSKAEKKKNKNLDIIISKIENDNKPEILDDVTKATYIALYKQYDFNFPRNIKAKSAVLSNLKSKKVSI